MKKQLVLSKDKSGDLIIRITFPFSYDLIDKVKTISGRRFHSEDKTWSVPLMPENITRLQEWGFELDDKLTSYISRMNIPVGDLEEQEIPGLTGQLFPFQSKGVSFIEKRQGRALIADEMGLGKTIQTIGWMQLHRDKLPVIIVVPASLKLNWKREIETWMSPLPSVQVLSGTRLHPTTGDILIINYDILPDWLAHLQSRRPQVLIIDEVHYIKNSSAQRTKAVKTLSKSIPHIIALSGTPIVNRPVEAYNALKIIDPTCVPSFWNYAHRYCGARNNGFGWDFSGATNTEELHQKLSSTVMIRRKKEDVLKDLPEKLRSFLPMELDNEKEYYSAEQDFISFLEKTKGREAAIRASNAETLAEIEGLKQLAVKGKLNQVIDWIRDFVEVDGKLVVFAVHRFVVDALMEAFPKISVKIDGGVSPEDRQRAVDRFQNDPSCRLFIGNIKAAGVGITLTASSNVAIVELPWTPGDLEQAIDRVHRIGQENKVTAYFLLATGTIEEKIARLLDRKRKVLDSVLDGRETEQESLLMELIKEY